MTITAFQEAARGFYRVLSSTDIAATKFKDDFKDFFKSNIRFTRTPDFIPNQCQEPGTHPNWF